MGDEEERLKVRRVFLAAGLGKPGVQDDALRHEIQDEIDRIDRELASIAARRAPDREISGA